MPVTSEESVEKKKKGLSVRKASGPYDTRSFTIPLTNIFNESFRTRILKKNWKRYNVCAIPKVTPCFVVEYLRPISHTSVLPIRYGSRTL